MGRGYSYKCGKCGHEYIVGTGIGMTYPSVYRETLSDIAEGKYGPELKELYEKTPYAAVNGDSVIYVCGRCGTWERGIDVSLYALDDPDSVPGTRFGEKTVAEWGYVPYVMPSDLKEKYHLLKRHYRYCGKCGKRMRKATTEEMEHLRCPVCGSENHAVGGLLWD